LALAHAAKAGALLDGREYVIPDDIHRWVVPVLAHRMILKRGAAQSNITAAAVLDEIKRGLIVP
jgi:MoxR-like ATPase